MDAPIGRHPVDRKKMAVTEKNSRPAVTHWEVIARYGQYSHLRCRLETGRTHQIRVHMAYIRHPIAGDPVLRHRQAGAGSDKSMSARAGADLSASAHRRDGHGLLSPARGIRARAEAAAESVSAPKENPKPFSSHLAVKGFRVLLFSGRYFAALSFCISAARAARNGVQGGAGSGSLRRVTASSVCGCRKESS